MTSTNIPTASMCETDDDYDLMYDLDDSPTTILKTNNSTPLLTQTSVWSSDIKDICSFLKNWEKSTFGSLKKDQDIEEVKHQDPKDYYCPFKNFLTEKDLNFLITTSKGKEIFKVFIDTF